MGGLGVFLLLSAAVVLVPVLLQVRSGESRLRDQSGFVLFAAGLVIAAAADSAIAGPFRTELAVAGVVASLVGLIVQSRLPQPGDRGP